MGVPGFFTWLINHYKENVLISDNLDIKVDTLYIDANCLFHPQCFKILEKSTELDVNKLENMMIERILNYIDYLISYVNPLKMVYIAVDGVAPLAKVNQQRKRRFKTVHDTALKNKIKRKYGMNTNDIWTNSVITPGSEFMEKLHIKLLNHCQTKKSIKIIYSSYHTCGEGEHKILQHIKTLSKTETSVIYGLDADLFFLSMASQVDNIYLLRENTQFNRKLEEEDKNKQLFDIIKDVAEDLKYVSIDIVKKCINEQIQNKIINKLKNLQNNQVININVNYCNDFIFLSILLGNDFLPHFPSLDIKNNGLDIIIDCYVNNYINYKVLLVKKNKNKVDINYLLLIDIIKDISKLENDYFIKTIPKIIQMKKNKTCISKDKYTCEIWKLDNLKMHIIDPIQLGIGNELEWKYRYYEHYFNTTDYMNLTIKEVCLNYLEGLKWVTEYYFNKCPDWKWQYLYNHAPFISDFYVFIKNEDYNINKIKFIYNKPIDIFAQLLSVLPPKNNFILPVGYRYLVSSIYSPIIDMFPRYISLDMLYKLLLWQCNAIVPVLNIDRILMAIKNIKLSPNELIRNKSLDEFKIN